MSNEFQLFIAIASLILGGTLSTAGWLCIRVIRRLDDMAEGLDKLRDKHGKEIRNTRTAISYVAGQLKLPEPRYDD